ncbi:hypothetical protein [Paenibacillus donghaensis]|uniref:hypothetical protein n=1 Tax=Paenibacillus donghaensis TaxID=414771 RepID=UPI0012FCE4E9|nr:hypothetical protein [Paenibacillus donghaensis]
MMASDHLPLQTEETKETRVKLQPPTPSSIQASDAIKYTAYVMLLFGFLYFLVQYLGPML